MVVGAGYTGTELVAQGEQLTREALRDHPGLSRRDVHWLLVDLAARVLPGLSERLSRPARRVLEKRGVEVRLETSVAEVTATCARLTDGAEIPTRTVMWCVGVRPDPMVEALGLPVEKGRLAVTTRLMSVRHNNVYGAGDAAAVPDVYHPGQLTPMTAQHAQRQGRVAGINVAASLGYGKPKDYRHRDLGFLVDLAGSQAVTDPLHIPISGWPAKTITRGYHLLTMPANRMRVAADWITNLLTRRHIVQFGLIPEQEVSLANADRLLRSDRGRS